MIRPSDPMGIGRGRPAGPMAQAAAGTRRTWRDRLRDLLGTAPLDTPADEGEPRYRPIDLKLIRRLLTHLRPYRRRYALGISLGVVMVLLEMQSPWFMGAIINWTTNFAAGQLNPMPTEPGAVRHVAVLVGLWGLVLAAALLLQRTTILIMVDAGERVQFDLRRLLFDQLQRLSVSFYDRTKLGRIISRCSTDINSLREVNVWGIDTVVKNAVMICVAAAMLLETEPRLFAAVAWLGPILFLLNRTYRKTAAVLYQRAREGFTRVSTNLAENITGIRVVTAFDRQSWNLGVFNVLQYNNTANNLRAALTLLAVLISCNASKTLRFRDCR